MTKKLINIIIALTILAVLLYKFYRLLRRMGIIERLIKDTAKTTAEPGSSGSALPVARTVAALSTVTTSSRPVANSPRARAVLAYLKAHKHATMADIRGRFPSVTARTLRRDLEKLERDGLVAQSGRTKNSSYHLV